MRLQTVILLYKKKVVVQDFVFEGVRFVCGGEDVVWWRLCEVRKIVFFLFY